MQFFQDLGSLVEQRWRDEDYCEEVFPRIAEEALAEAATGQNVDPWEIIRWLNTTAQLPNQQDVDGIFGDPPITLFCGPRFHIDVYYWLDGTTSTHQHSFSGAFQVLLGSSIHSQYSFKEEQKINAHFSTGQLSLNKVELLEEGNIRQIIPGKKYIHSLFHLDRPSATVVIRTYRTVGSLPQYQYHKPYIALDPFYKSPAMIRKLQGASLLLGMKHPEAYDIIGEVLSGSDFQTAFSMLNLAFNHMSVKGLEEAFGISTAQERFESLLEIARRRHGALVDLIPPVFDEVKRQNYLIQRRGQITGNEHRFFLALLLNVPDRSRVLELVRQRFPEQNPVETIVGWVDELANTKMIGSSESNVLGINNLDDDYLFVLQCMLEGHTIEQVRSAFEEEVSPVQTESTQAETTQAETTSDKPEQLYNAIRDSMPFKSIFLNQSDATFGGR